MRYNEFAAPKHLWKNLTAREIIRRCQPYKELRGLVVDDDAYYWPAAEAIHGSIAKQLGIGDWYVDNRFWIKYVDGEVWVFWPQNFEYGRGVNRQFAKLMASPDLYFDSGSAGWITGPEVTAQLTEAPIASFELTGGEFHGQPRDFADGETFDGKDAKLLQSEKGQMKIMRAFQKTRQNFRVIFHNGLHFNGSDSIDNGSDLNRNIQKVKSGIHDSVHGVDGRPGYITVMIMGNLSADDKMPMNAWTLAHKIGHSFQDYEAAQTSWADQVPTDILKQVHVVDDTLHAIDRAEFGRMQKGGQDARMQRFGTHRLTDALTMKSAREGKLREGFEVFPEVIAQYLLQGSVTTNLQKPEARDALASLNVAIAKLFRLAEGKVMVNV